MHAMTWAALVPQAQPPQFDRAKLDLLTLPAVARAGEDLRVWEQSHPGQDLYLPPSCMHTFIVPVGADSAADWISFGGHVQQVPAAHVVRVPAGCSVYLHSSRPRTNLHVSLATNEAANTGSDTWARLDKAIAGRSGGLALLDGAGQSLAAALRAAARASASGTGFVVRQTALALIDHVVSRQQPVQAGSSQLSPRQMHAVTSYIQDHLGRPFSLRDLSKLVGLSPAHFCRCFMATAGTSPMKFATRLRMERARELVESCTLPMGEIACETGFADGAHFSRAFRKYWGLPPTELRRRVRDV